MRTRRTRVSKANHRASNTVQVDVTLPNRIHAALSHRVGTEEEKALTREIVEILTGAHPPVSVEEVNSTFFAPTPTLEEMAAAQQVSVVADPTTLLGDFWPEDESTDDFIATVRAWRKDDAA